MVPRSAPRPDGARSLASVAPGRSVRIDHILFSTLREHCGQIGLREGQIVRCRGGAGDGVVVQLPTGRTATIARHLARFIEVRELSALAAGVGDEAHAVTEFSPAPSAA